jgi:hypothetical protein
MKSDQISRRDFLKLFSLSVVGAVLPIDILDTFPWLAEINTSPSMKGRITRKTEVVYAEPDFHSPRQYRVERDTVLPLLEEISSPSGPNENPRWYRNSDGYLHSAYVQRVDGAHQNEPLSYVPQAGLLGEVTVPFTQTMFFSREGYRMKLYRLYYGSTHWITGMIEGPDGEPWYRLTDELLRVNYYAPAAHLRVVTSQELEPISSEVPKKDKKIRVSLDKQVLTAFEGDRLVLLAPVSTGRRYMETPSGEFHINRKFPSRHMGYGGLTRDVNAYELVGVPWVSFFHDNGVAFHGTFWHDNFGVQMSHGCVNMRNEDARWLFRWSKPIYGPQANFSTGRKLVADGTTVIVT